MPRNQPKQPPHKETKEPAKELDLQEPCTLYALPYQYLPIEERPLQSEEQTKEPTYRLILSNGLGSTWHT